ncbi:Cis-aconitate decarboxylase [Cyphellophora attinorum]|uniref:Cis-aconitate decarboxylase n=1 Tax=Cyphellophora attinorum TaxID=1664694 RepID=A0A0N0NIZ6_9EURO|nr:Cis-aconitate decarboxylase [Phialophora attinorum]KPI36401.1 Cis-aconitate decarboxylase [Phialophora attinorum]
MSTAIKTNGTTNGVGDEHITDAYVDFIVDAKYEALPEKAISKLKDLIIDHIGVAAGAALGSDSSAPIFKGIQAFSAGTTGSCTVYTKGHNFAPQYAALLNGAFAHSYDFDDTYAPGTVHPGASVIPATLAQAQVTGASGQDVLLAIAVGYEIVCRLSRALGAGSYTRGFHNTATTGIFGSIGAICKLRGLPRQVVVDALGLAGSKASGSMQFLHNGSWNKRLHPVGLLHAFSESSDTHGLTEALGSHWEFPLTALKPFSACRYTHTGIEIVNNVAKELGRDNMPKKMEVRLGKAGYGIVGTPVPGKLSPQNLVDAQFSNYYQLAVTWFHGAGIGFAAYDDDKFNDKRVRELCGRISHIEDPECPVWGTIIDIEMEDGKKIHKMMEWPLGEEQHPFSPAQVREKFHGLVTKVYDDARAGEIVKAVDGIESSKVADILKLL